MESKKNYLYYPVNDYHFDRGNGIYLYDKEGKEYIDCASATFNLSLGYGHKEVIDAAKEQMDKCIHLTSSYQSDPILDLAEKLVEVAPDNLNKVHPKVSSGSVANEGAIKMAQVYSNKRGVISTFRSHLGQSKMMMSISGNAFRRESFPLSLNGYMVVPDPYCNRCFYGMKKGSCNYACVEKINDFIDYGSCGQVACMIVEPISGNGGNIIPPKGYFKALRKLCDEHDIVLIFDEIQTGIGRTGEVFAAQYYDVKPNIMTVAKGLGGSGFQVAAILAEEKFCGLKSYDHSFTYGSNLMSAAAAVKTLEIVSKASFLDNVKKVGNYILERLEKAKEIFPFIDDVRGVGLMIGFEIVKSDGSPDVDLTNFLEKEAMKYGLIMRTSRYGFGNVLKIRPPLIITMEQAEELCDRLFRMLKDLNYNIKRVAI